MARILIFIYSILISIVMWPAGLLLERHPNFRGTMASRLGLKLPRVPKGRPALWIHAASMGEVKAVAGLIRAIRKAAPDLFICLSTMTATGRQVAAGIRELDHVMPFPFDGAWVMRRFMKRMDPKALIIVETELWPNLIRAARGRHVPVFVVNARMTTRSFRRYGYFRDIAALILDNVRVLAMAESDAERFSKLGAKKVSTLGNLKLDSLSEVNMEKREAIRATLGAGDRPVFIAGSIREGEEAKILEALRRAKADVPELFSILAPRHHDQVVYLADLAEKGRFAWCRRSKMEKGADVVIVDTMGELFSLYGASDVAFVGGSLVNVGGQNILEPIAWGIPTIHGPHMDNFIWALEVVEGFTIRVNDTSELGEAIVDILVQPEKYYDLAQEARYLLEKRKGVTDRYLNALLPYLR